MPVRPGLPAVVIAGLVLAAAPGCGPGTASVSGRVTFRGKPLAMGTVYMAGPDGIHVPAAITADGTYRIGPIPTGRARVSVASVKPVGGTAVPAIAMKAGPGTPPPPPPPDLKNWVEIPEKYADANTSGLTADLKAGANVHDIDLQ